MEKTNEKPYFTTIVAFSTPSGRLHIGHALGQVTGDVATRYAELHGKKPFFPFGIHSTGDTVNLSGYEF